VDALRLRFPLGFMGEIDAGYVFGSEFHFDRSAFFLRIKTYLAQTDVAFLILGFRENLLLGLDVARSLGGAGFWVEAGYVAADAFRKKRSESSRDFLRLSTGLDYSLSGSTYGFLEYHFNGGGASQAQDYLASLSNPALREASVFLLGKHYLIPGISHQFTPLLGLTAQALWNLSDGSVFLAPALEYSLTANLYLTAGGFWGKGALRRSEFGAYPETIYTSLNIYF
jgi:hypothetical protein